MASALYENRTLLWLDLTNNRLDCTVGGAMLPMLRTNTSILTIRLSGE